MKRDDLTRSNKKEDVKRDEKKEKVDDKKNSYFIEEFDQYFFHQLDCE